MSSCSDASQETAWYAVVQCVLLQEPQILVCVKPQQLYLLSVACLSEKTATLFWKNVSVSRLDEAYSSSSPETTLAGRQTVCLHV